MKTQIIEKLYQTFAHYQLSHSMQVCCEQCFNSLPYSEMTYAV